MMAVLGAGGGGAETRWDSGSVAHPARKATAQNAAKAGRGDGSVLAAGEGGGICIALADRSWGGRFAAKRDRGVGC